MLKIVHCAATATPATGEPIFHELYEQHWELLFKISLKKTGSLPDATDLVQDVFTQVWENLATLDLHSPKFRSYLITSLYYRIFNYLRNKKLQQKHYQHFGTFLLNEPASNNNLKVQQAEMELEAINKIITAELNRLPFKMKQIFSMSWYENKSIGQIAEELCLSRQTIKNQLSAAVKRVRRFAQQNLVGVHFSLLILLLYANPSGFVTFC